MRLAITSRRQELRNVHTGALISDRGHIYWTTLAFIYNAIGIPVAAGLLYSFLGILLSPMIAGATMSLSPVSVIGNALRLRTLNLEG